MSATAQLNAFPVARRVTDNRIVDHRRGAGVHSSARKGGKPERIMIDATHLKAHRTAASLLKKDLFPDVSGARKAA